MHLPLWIGLRYHGAKNKQRFLSVLSWVSLLGMILGIAALIIVLSVMNGFQLEIKQRLLAVMPHGVFEKVDKAPVSNWPQALSALQDQLPKPVRLAPLVQQDAMLQVGGSLIAAELKGIEPSIESRLSGIDQHMIAGKFTALDNSRFGIVIGSGLAAQLGVTVGDNVTVKVTRILHTLMGPTPRSRQFTIVGVFEVGADVDATDAFIKLTDAQVLLGYKSQNQIDGFRFALDDAFAVGAFTDSFRKTPAATSWLIVPWTETRQQLFSAIKMEKVMVTLLLTMVIAVAAFNLISMMTMMVASKRNEIAVLRMMGISRKQVLGIFMVQGVSLALMSVIIGGGLGMLLAFYLGDLISFLETTFGFYIFDPSVFYISGLPSDLQLNDVLYVVVLTLVMALMFVLYPAYRATQIQPVEALHYQ